MTHLIKQHAFALFSTLTILLSFGAYFLPIPREAVPVVMVFVPALVAAALAGLTGGGAAVRALLGKLGQWRLRLGWVLMALALALALRLAVSVVAVVLGITPTLQLRPGGPVLVVLAIVVFVFAVPEELGWRGYALPLLLPRWSPLAAGLIIGVLWGALHLALHLPGMMYAALPVLPTLPLMVGLSVLITWVYLRSEGNLIIASLFHGAQSFFVVLNEGIPPAEQSWLMAGVCVIAAVVVTLASRGFGRRLVQPPAAVAPRVT